MRKSSSAASRRSSESFADMPVNVPARVSSKGQVTLPTAMRRQLGTDRVRIRLEGRRLIIEPDQGLYGALSAYAQAGDAGDFAQEREAAWGEVVREREGARRDG